MNYNKLSNYIRFCPNCWEIITDERLKQSLVCEKCLEKVDFFEDKIDRPLWYYFYDQIKNKQNIKLIKDFFDKVDEFTLFFKNLVWKYPWSLQLTWAKRVFMGNSFSIVAPTWVGKTTWWLIIGLYKYLHWEKKIYYILPTTVLTIHTFERFKQFAEKYCQHFGVCKKDFFDKVLVYHGKLKQKEKKLTKEKIANWDFDILFTTTNFLYRDFELLSNFSWKFKFIFVDDVDSLLKSAKNIDYVLKLMWFTDQDIDLWMQLIKLKISLLYAKWEKLQQIQKQIEEISQKLQFSKSKINSILVASSATAKPKWLKIKLLRELLDFEVWGSSTNLRNVEDLFVNKNLNLNFEEEKINRFNLFMQKYEVDIQKILDILKDWILVFLPSDLWKDLVNIVVNWLNNKWYIAESYENLNDEVIEKFRNKQIKVLVWIASWRNPLARWLDLPDAVKYALFLGVPKFIFNANIDISPKVLIGVIMNLSKILPDQIKKMYDWDNEVVRWLRFLNKISNYTKEYLEKNEEILKTYQQITSKVNEILQREDVKQILFNSEDISFDWKNFVIADVAAYIQASGRTSRMYVWGLSKWVSIIFVDNKKAFNNLQKRMKWYYDDIQFKKLELDENV